MKKFISGLLALAMLSGANISAIANDNVYKEFYVSTSGSDTNPGTKSAPFRTLHAAQKAVRNVNEDMTGDIIVNINEGTYYLDEMLDMGNLDSGCNGYRVIWKGVGKQAPNISGGTRVSGFEDNDGDGIYTADLSDYGISYVYQLSVNGLRRYMAKGAALAYGQTGTDGSYYYDDPEVNYDGDEFDKDTDGDYIPDANYPDYEGIYVSKKDLGFYENAEDMFFAWNRGFQASYIPVRKIKEDPDNSSQLRVLMRERYDEITESIDSRIAYQSSTAPYADRGFIIMNAMELLDEPGEFYFDRAEKNLCYIPMADEDMEIATVVIPRLETLVSIDGNDVDDRAKNITFSNLHFCDTLWNTQNGFRNGQSYDITGNGQTSMAQSAVLVQRASNIEFSDNVFSNTGAMGINYYNAVSDSVILGNAFYDIGITAISSGACNHGELGMGLDGVSDAVPSAYESSPIELVDNITTKTTTSFFENHSAIYYPGYAGPDDGGWTIPDHKQKRNVTWAEYNVLPQNVWRDDVSAAKGKKPYVMFEFLKPYTLDKISVCFPDTVTDAEKTNIEILASNDKTFADATKVVSINKVPSAGVNHYSVNDDAKYKYVMIRKTDLSDMAMSRVWITSQDKKPYVKNEICRNLTIENNIIDRCGVSTNHSVGLIVTHGDSHSICHNEIYNTGYSGISIGYSWNHYKTCYNMDVGYNYVQNACRACNDGGPIYILGAQPGSRYYNNHMIDGNHAIHGLYTDNGSSGEVIENNLMESSLGILSPYVSNSMMWNDGCNQYKTSDGTMLHRKNENGKYVYYYADKSNQQEHGEIYTGADLIRIPANNSIHDCIFRNNFGTHPYSSDAGKMYNDYEEPIMQPVGYSTDPIAYDTLTNAGLECEYEYLKDLIPKNIDNMYSKYTYDNAAYKGELKNHDKASAFMKHALTYEMNNTLKNAEFGAGLGMYPLEWKSIIQNAITFWEATNYGMEDISLMSGKYTLARNTMLELRKNPRRYSVDETINMCDQLIKEAQKRIWDNAVGSYPKAAVEEAKTSLEEVKIMPESTPEEEFAKLTAAESVYNNLMESRCAAGIKEVYVPKAEKVDIDDEKNTVTVYMPYGESLTVENIKITPDDNSVVTDFIGGKQNLADGITVPILCEDNGRYRLWKIKAENVFSKSKVTKNDFTVLSDEAKFVRKGIDGDILPASAYAYMSTVHNGDEEVSVEFSPLTRNNIKVFNMIFGASISGGFFYGSLSESHNRFQVEFTDEKAVLYSVANGEITQIAVTTSNILWNEKNTLAYRLNETGSGTMIEISLNGQMLFSQSANGVAGRYMGIYSPYMNIKVY